MAYRIIIADDEKKILQLIRELGHWEELDIEIIAECQSGEQALEYILKFKPDFVLSDIKMPVIDGIKLIEKTREKNQEIMFVLLSGYRHFEYARSAIQLNVVDYLLKPIDENQLNETLEKLCRKVDKEREKIKQESIINSIEAESERLRLNDFWNFITKGEGTEENRKYNSKKQFNEKYGTDFLFDSFQVISTYTNINAMYEHKQSLFSDKVDQFIKQNFAEIAKVYYLTTYMGQILVINYDEKNRSEIKNAINILFCKIRDLKEIYGDFRINFGCSNIKHTENELRKAFIEANAAEWGRLNFMGNSIIEYNQIEHLSRFDINELITADSLRSLRDCVKYLKNEELRDILSEVYKKAGLLNHSNPLDMRNSYWEINNSIIYCIEDKNKRLKIEENNYFSYLEARNFQQLYKNMFIRLDEYISEEEKIIREKLKKPLGDAIEFIKKNYMKPLALEDVSEACNISQGYLSKLFKKELEIGFSEYITQIRVEESMQMLSGTNKSIKEIAVKVGYTDEKYYSKIFKKTVGIKPTEYRRLYG